jgi:hypothetical protein
VRAGLPAAGGSKKNSFGNTNFRKKKIDHPRVALRRKNWPDRSIPELIGATVRAAESRVAPSPPKPPSITPQQTGFFDVKLKNAHSGLWKADLPFS